jgi:MFS transporter, PPP family, 3-phenylpropionic acid transporter
MTDSIAPRANHRGVCDNDHQNIERIAIVLMLHESQIPITPGASSKRFAAWLALVYATGFGLVGTHLPFFPVWLKAVGVDTAWIGIITAVPSVTRFTTLPFVTSFAERHQALRAGIIAMGFATTAGLAVVGLQHQTLLIFLAYAMTCGVWTPMVPLIDAYALRGVRQYGLSYGPLRLWGSAAFVAGALACGVMIDVIAAKNLIWIIAGVAALSALASLGLQPLAPPKSSPAALREASTLLRDKGFLAIIVTSALIQSSHSAYYVVASIAWQQEGLGGLTIASLWTLGVLAEIVVFALSPRFTLPPAMLVVIAACCAVVRWIMTAQAPPLAMLAAVQLMHGLTFGLTQVGTMGLMVHHVPGRVMARGQGYLAACSGIIAGTAYILSGVIFARYGQNVYYVMAVIAASGGLVMFLARHRLSGQPHNAGSGG